MQMLILPGRGGALDADSALKYAALRGYTGKVLKIDGPVIGDKGSVQHLKAVEVYRGDSTISALYGFSAGGYNTFHVINSLTTEERARLRLVVVLGAPERLESDFKAQGTWELVYRKDPPGGHMDGPRALLAEAAKASGADPSFPTPPWLLGWWKIMWGEDAYYYLFEANGRVKWSEDPPTTNHSMKSVGGNGTCLALGHKLTIPWTSSGSVEEFEHEVGTREMSGVWNKREALTAEKMF